MNTPISFRLRKQIDADLIAQLDQMERDKIAELCRDGLRLMLGIRTTKQTHIVERPIIAPEHPQEVKGTTVTRSMNKPLVGGGIRHKIT